MSPGEVTAVPSTHSASPYHPPPCVLVPIYNAPAYTEACILSVLRETHPPYRVLLLDDASTDPSIHPMLAKFASQYSHVALHTQEHNQGFAGNVNFGLAHTEGDVVLLNSDTQVTTGWLAKLVSTAYSRCNVATVTPVSNAAGAFSVPTSNIVNELPPLFTPAMVASRVARTAAPVPVEAPTGNGFCLYIRRSALDKLGLLDSRNFPHIGEENDFCQRAVQEGFVNLIDTSCYIFHVRSASFQDGEFRRSQLEAARRRLDARYPQYTANVRRLLDSSILQAFRRRLSCTLRQPPRSPKEDRPRVLSVVHAGKGGMVHTNLDLMRSLSQDYEPYILQCDTSRWMLNATTSGDVLAEWYFSATWQSMVPTDVRRRLALRSLLEVYGFELVHIRTLIATGPEILHTLAGTGVKILVSFHDFSIICPTIQLIDDQHRFCGGHCTPGHGTCRVAARWFGTIRNLKHDAVYTWRRRMTALLPLADAFVTTSVHTRSLILEHFPALGDRPFPVIEHGRDRLDSLDVAVPPGNPLRLVCFGAFNAAKGLDLMQTIFEIVAREKMPFEFHVLGDINRCDALAGPAVTLHGSYEREALPSLLHDISPSYAMICSIWPETYCHTLTEAWYCGLPVLASNIGVLAERIGKHGGGRLVDPSRPHLWITALQALSQDSEWRALRQHVESISLPSASEMAARYSTLYSDLLSNRLAPAPSSHPSMQVRTSSDPPDETCL